MGVLGMARGQAAAAGSIPRIGSEGLKTTYAIAVLERETSDCLSG